MIWRLNYSMAGGNIPAGYAVYAKIVGDPHFGDEARFELVDKSVDIGRNPILPSRAPTAGREVVPDNLPKQFTIAYDFALPREEGLALPDIFAISGTIVSERFRAVVEALEPGVHQFVPIQYVPGNGPPSDYGFYWFFAHTRIFPMDPERTYPPMRPYPEGPDWVRPFPDKPAYTFHRTAAPDNEWKPFFDQEIVDDHHVFVAGELPDFFCVSDAFKTAVEEAGLTGAGFIGPWPVGPV